MPSDNHIKAALSLIEDKSKILGLTIGNYENVQPGTYLPRKACQEPPKLSFTGTNPNSTYMIVSMDIDAPFPGFGVLGPILHWIQSDVKATSEGVLEYEAPFVANYIGPAPPPMSSPHRYTFFLYEQPADFDLTAHAPAGGKKLGNYNQSCQIVNIDWLLKKIGNDIPEHGQKETIKGERNEESKPKGRKRARESSVRDDEDNPSKRTKDEEQIKLKYLISLVDEKYPNPSSTLSVYQDDTGLIWDATLVSLGVRKVQICRIQLLLRRESQKFHLWNLQYQCGSSETSTSIGRVGSLDSVKRAFEVKFKSLSHLEWEDRNDIPSSKGWIFLQMPQREVPVFTSRISPLPTSVEDVLKIIFTSGADLKNYVHLLNSQGRGILLENQVDKKKLLIGIAVLAKLMELTNPQLNPCDTYKAKNKLCNFYNHLILTQGTLSDNKDIVRQELESLDLLLKLRDASEILEKDCRSSSLAMSQISQVVGLAKMLPVRRDSTEFKMLQEYIEKTSYSQHIYQFKEIIGLFRLERPGEAERFAQWEKENLANIGDRRLLWHGSKASNFAGILSQGLRGDGIVSTDGKRFLPGVYFADMSTKSAQYCKGNGEVLMLLCEVELGKSTAFSVHHLGMTVHNKWRDAGYIHPDFKGCQVPDVHAGRSTTTPNGRRYYTSEYIAKNPAQIRQRYLFHVKLVQTPGT
ncbi:hypothetical protein DTO012A9_1093 [Penicillium roqueforti]|nr:hypothetical protein CBS147310_5319 [Penicillium roqueforti]KAI3267697.1 hypothetical protein DTO012A9_1093 [Penicillium roqueforti]